MKKTFKRFQKGDYSRLGLVNSAILGHDTGLGKTWAGYTFGFLKCGFERDGHRLMPKGSVLIVAPGDLHKQWIREGAEHFKAHVTHLDSQATFLALSELGPDGRRRLKPGFYITSYTELGSNGVRLLPKPEKLETLGEARVAMNFLGGDWDALVRAEAREGELARRFEDLEPDAQLLTAQRAVARRLGDAALGVGVWNTDRYTRARQVRTPAPAWRIKCVWDPTLADLCADSFDCVVVDEATKLKGGFDTKIGAGVLQLTPRYRLVCTATPIKNRLPNIFPLAWWACGGQFQPHSRWPYTLEDAGDFARTFCVSERNLTREAEAEGKSTSRFTKLTPQVCNVHKVWKLLAPIVLRRRKKDIGEDIVGKSRQVYRVPMGVQQAKVYLAHLEWEPEDKNGKPAIGPKLQALRMAAAAPNSPLLPKMRGPAYCPKMAATLTLIDQILRKGKQVIVFSPFHDPLDAIGDRLRQAGVDHSILDGRMSQAKRANSADLFKKRGYPVLLASNECMAEGHSFPLCSYVIQYAYPWALDKVLQSEDRAHRINSVEPLQVYRLITEGSIDRKMEAQIDEKGDAAELVLDGHLLGENAAEVNLAELLEIAAQEFKDNENLIPEARLEAEWPELRDRLRAASENWQTGLVETPPNIIPLPPAPEPPKVHWRARWQRRQEQGVLL